MFLQVVLWIAIAVVALIVGRQAGKWLFGAKKDLSNLKRAAQKLAIALREHGLRRLPEVLEEFTVGDVPDLMNSIHEFALVLKSGNDVIIKELENTFDRMLGVKLNSPEGRAALKARVAEAEKVALEVAKVAAPIVITAAVAAL